MSRTDIALIAWGALVFGFLSGLGTGMALGIKITIRGLVRSGRLK